MNWSKTLWHWRTSFAYLLLSLATNLWAGNVTLQWDPNTEPDVAGYKLHYYEVSAGSTNIVDVGSTNSHSLRAIDPGEYRFFVTAYSVDGIESDPSNEVGYAVKTPSPFTVSVKSGSICRGDVIELVAISSDAVSYLWSNGATNASILVSPEESQSYSVTVLSKEGVEAQAEAIVTVDALPTVAVNSGAIRAGESIELTATASEGVSYLWSNGATTPSITVSPLATETFSVLVSSASGCVASAVAQVVVTSSPDPEETLTQATLELALTETGLSLNVGIEGGKSWVLEGSSDFQSWANISGGSGSQTLSFVGIGSAHQFFRVRSVPADLKQ